MSATRNKQRWGFTIVELLIVIVVIAILAAISIVAYNGIQTRANNTQTIDATKQFIKAYSLYALDNSDYPNASGCLGDTYPAPNQKCLSQATAPCFGGTGGATGSAINVALKPYMNNKVPQPSMQSIPCGGAEYIGAAGFYQTGNKTVTIFMILRGDQTCPSMSPNVASYAKSYVADATRCVYILAAV